jgi:predicted Zn finger-like uncharacterized protein
MKKSTYPLIFLTPITEFNLPSINIRRTSSSSLSTTTTATRLHLSSTLTDIPNRNKPEWDTQQHLYGLDLHKDHDDGSSVTTINADGEVSTAGSDPKSLPLPETYVTCGRCKSLFAIAESDLGNMGKGCRVKCSVCSNSWYQSRDRLYDIPTIDQGYEMKPSPQSDIDRIARNLANNHAPDFYGVNKLYVGNLDYTTTSQDLLQFFEENTENCKVCDASIVKGQDGRNRGFAFVSFYPGSSVEEALEMNGKEFCGRELSVKEPNN